MTDPKQPLAWRHVAQLLLSLVMVMLPHAERLPWWTLALVAALIAWRAYQGHTQIGLPSHWLLFLIGLGGTLGVLISYRTIFGRDAGIALLVVMLGLKLLETRTQRDAVLLILLGYFLVLTNFLYSQTIPTALYMLVCILVITTTMVSLHYARVEPPLRVRLRTAGMLLAQSIPLTLALFVLFPRVPGPLWGLPQDSFTGVSGLSDTMSPGSLSKLILLDAVAFRVKFESPLPRLRNLYWRGPVMWDFDGRTWSAPRFFTPIYELKVTGEPVKYEVMLEPHNKRWLFALDVPGSVPPLAFLSTDFQIFSAEPVNNRRRYEVQSLINASHGLSEGRLTLRRALRLPAGLNPRTVALAQSLREKHADDLALIEAVLKIFRDEKFFYTLEPPLLGEHPVDEFLFSTRSGFCEHYASAFAVLMRAAGIPARIVTGYQGGEINNLGNYLIVRQAEAHAWTEVWLKDRGWLRVDPTSSVSPLRVDSGISAAVPRSESLPLMARGDYELLRQLRLTWDFMANTWNHWVLGYTPERQLWLLSSVGMDNVTWQKLTAFLFILAGLIVAAFTALVLRQLKGRVRDPARQAYLRFCDKLRRKGLACAPAEGPVDYARRVGNSRPELGPAAAAITRLYVALRYSARAGIAELTELKQRVRQFTA